MKCLLLSVDYLNYNWKSISFFHFCVINQHVFKLLWWCDEKCRQDTPMKVKPKHLEPPLLTGCSTGQKLSLCHVNQWDRGRNVRFKYISNKIFWVLIRFKFSKRVKIGLIIWSSELNCEPDHQNRREKEKKTKLFVHVEESKSFNVSLNVYLKELYFHPYDTDSGSKGAVFWFHSHLSFIFL